jgi:hypothetical protein
MFDSFACTAERSTCSRVAAESTIVASAQGTSVVTPHILFDNYLGCDLSLLGVFKERGLVAISHLDMVCDGTRLMHTSKAFPQE